MLDAFLASLAENPEDDSFYLILADWLEQQDNSAPLLQAELIRLQHALRQPGSASNPRKRGCPMRQAQEDRMRCLLAQGVLPCLPRLCNSISMQLVMVPPGTFLMGSPEAEEGRCENEHSQQEVEIRRGFYIGVHPVTQRQYETVIGANPSYFHSGSKGGPDHPVEQVSWTDAQTFCQRLSSRDEERRTGRVYRLPMEAEWEYACRAGTSSPFWWGAKASSTQANFFDETPSLGAELPSPGQTSAVGQYPPNPWGLYDMHGNVYEWCADWYEEPYALLGNKSEPQGPRERTGRVWRGGSWFNSCHASRAARRLANRPSFRNFLTGFRVVMTLASWGS
jgi:uncharacterized protein (TIGR02996 family)